MGQISYSERIKNLSENLFLVPQSKLVEMLIERVSYDQSLCRYLESVVGSNLPGVEVAQIVDVAKSAIEAAYGKDLDNLTDASSHVPELYADQTLVEQIFAQRLYQEVVDLVDYSLEFTENISSAIEPDDSMDTAYNSLLVLWLRSHLKIGGTPETVAQLFRARNDNDQTGLFCHLPYFYGEVEAELKLVKRAFEESA